MGRYSLLSLLMICFISFRAEADAGYIDSLLQQLSKEEQPDKQFDLIFEIFSPDFESDPYLIIETGNKLMDLGEDNHNLMFQSAGNSFLGHGYRLMGNITKGLAYHHDAVRLAEKTGHESLIGFVHNQLANIYKDRNDLRKAISLYQLSKSHADKGHHARLRVWPVMNTGATYLNAGIPDSALMNLQRAYSECVILRYDKIMAYILTNLGGAHSMLGNDALAVTFYHEAKVVAESDKSIRYLNRVYSGLAEHYCAKQVNDSCAYYSRKAIAVVDSTVFFYLSMRPAWLLTAYYESKNCDSTLKYARFYKSANDSLNNAKAVQRIQIITLEEEIRQKDQLEALELQKQNRRQNIQYAALALGIVLLISLWLLLSRNIITNRRTIHFFSVIALLLIFEFLNLVLHPLLGKITHHTPSLMLLGLVCIGALLVPLHHRLEKLAIERLVKKNEEIRLARAKKTIEEIEGKREQ